MHVNVTQSIFKIFLIFPLRDVLYSNFYVKTLPDTKSTFL